jgi:hypothetical protein
MSEPLEGGFPLSISHEACGGVNRMRRPFGRLAGTTRLESTAWCFKLRSRRDAVPARGLRCRSVATSTVAIPFGGGLSSWEPTMLPDGFVAPRPRSRRARMPQMR